MTCLGGFSHPAAPQSSFQRSNLVVWALPLNPSDFSVAVALFLGGLTHVLISPKAGNLKWSCAQNGLPLCRRFKDFLPALEGHCKFSVCLSRQGQTVPTNSMPLKNVSSVSFMFSLHPRISCEFYLAEFLQRRVCLSHNPKPLLNLVLKVLAEMKTIMSNSMKLLIVLGFSFFCYTIRNSQKK